MRLVAVQAPLPPKVFEAITFRVRGNRRRFCGKARALLLSAQAEVARTRPPIVPSPPRSAVARVSLTLKRAQTRAAGERPASWQGPASARAVAPALQSAEPNEAPA